MSGQGKLEKKRLRIASFSKDAMDFHPEFESRLKVAAHLSLSPWWLLAESYLVDSHKVWVGDNDFLVTYTTDPANVDRLKAQMDRSIATFTIRRFPHPNAHGYLYYWERPVPEENPFLEDELWFYEENRLSVKVDTGLNDFRFLYSCAHDVEVIHCVKDVFAEAGLTPSCLMNMRFISGPSDLIQKARQRYIAFLEETYPRVDLYDYMQIGDIYRGRELCLDFVLDSPHFWSAVEDIQAKVKAQIAQYTAQGQSIPYLSIFSQATEDEDIWVQEVEQWMVITDFIQVQWWRRTEVSS